MAEAAPPAGVAQTGGGSVYPRRRPADSKLDPEQSIAEQFALLRVVDNRHYPAYLDWKGHRYTLSIEKAETGTEDNR
jgi:methionyl-tRNA formyltransferase